MRYAAQLASFPTEMNSWTIGPTWQKTRPNPPRRGAATFSVDETRRARRDNHEPKPRVERTD